MNTNNFFFDEFLDHHTNSHVKSASIISTGHVTILILSQLFARLIAV